MKTYEIEFPLKHPKYVIEDVHFRKQLYRIMAKGHPFVAKFRVCEYLILLLRYYGLKGVWKAAAKKLFK